MHFYYKKQKLFLTLFIVLEFFVTNAFPASALFGGPSIPSASSILSDMEQRYHLDPATLQNQGETMNVAGTKGSAPEVSLSFIPSDPKPGEKLSAKAFPMYFSNEEKSLYYTWYLKRKDCDLKQNVKNIDILDKCNASDPKRGTLNRKNPDDITIEDWKIEAAKIIAQNGYEGPPSSATFDDDGYRARFGGDSKSNVDPYCYVHDFDSGTNYELSNKGSSSDFGCPPDSPNVHYSPKCLVAETGVGSSTTDPDTGVTTYTSSSTGSCSFSGLPVCGSDEKTTCVIGTPSCVANSALPTACSGDPGVIPILPTFACSRGTKDPLCEHLFPLSYKLDGNGNVSNNMSSGKKDLKVGETGGSFGVNEERFWGTDPSDPSTADNGNKDEANVVGLGQSTFTWNYDSGDKVGVAVEGTSMTPTKHESASYMIMWAFPKKCSVSDYAKGTGDYVEPIKGYDVSIPTAEFDLNKCIAYIPKKSDGSDDTPDESGLVDPTEGGQATNLSVSVSATPDNPINDPSGEKSGDTITTQATVDNAAQSIANILFDWKVYIGNSISSFNSAATSKDITSELRDLKLLGNTKGNALDSISLKLDIKDAEILGPGNKTLLEYLDNNKIGYLKFQSTATENFSDGIARKGKSDIIVKFISSTDSITAYIVKADSSGDTTKVSLNTSAADGGKICFSDPLDRTVCRVIKNEIIGLNVPDPSHKLSNFTWTINGSPLVCTARVSDVCAKGGSGNIDAESQGPTNFFPVSGNVGDTYTVTMTANDIVSGKTVTLTRSFNVVEPKVVIKSTSSDAWQKFLGQYKDIAGTKKSPGVVTCPNGLCDDLSESIYQTYSGSNLGFYADFMPDVISGVTTQEWTVDGDVIIPTNFTDNSNPPASVLTKQISINSADKQAGGVYTINLLAQVVQSDGIRKAMLDIWGISPFDSPEINFASSIQVEVQEVLTTEGPLSGPRKYYAAIASYIPASILFTFRIFLSVALTLFVLSLLNSLLEERRLEAFVRSFSRSRDK